MRKRPIPTRRFIKPSFTSLIEKKRDGQEFTQEEIRYIIDSTLDGEMPKHQQAALLTAAAFSCGFWIGTGAKSCGGGPVATLTYNIADLFHW